jgi:UDP-N-acetyl-alpha-D-muramoyl-L-alanyl-L-glutamate epimerase
VTLVDPRKARSFRFVRREYDSGIARLVYAFDDGPELIERIAFPDALPLSDTRRTAFDAALRLLHLIAGVSYFKAGVPEQIEIVGDAIDASTGVFMDDIYLHGLAEFGYHNKLDLRGKIRFHPPSRHSRESGNPVTSVPNAKALDSRFRGNDERTAPNIGLPRRTLVPIGGGKDSLVTVDALKRIAEPATAVWIGDSALIAACAQRTGLPLLNIKRQLAPELFEYNKLGAYNGHIPVTAINSAILVCAAVLYGFDVIAFSNERSASVATLEYNGQSVNHQWSKGIDFERELRAHVARHIAADLDYFSLLRPLSELAVTRAFARETQYDDVFSSCNRNFRIRGERPSDRWCGRCPKCHFVFLALAPFVAKPRLLNIFGRNLLDDIALAPGFDALLEYHEHKPFECVGEGRESRAAMFALSQRPEWREDALVMRFNDEILPQLDRGELALDPLLVPDEVHFVPQRLTGVAFEAG